MAASSAGAGTDFQIQAGIVARIFGQQQDVQRGVQIEQLLLQALHVVGSHLAQFGIVEHGVRFGQLAFGPIMLVQRDSYRIQLRIFL